MTPGAVEQPALQVECDVCRACSVQAAGCQVHAVAQDPYDCIFELIFLLGGCCCGGGGVKGILATPPKATPPPKNKALLRIGFP